MALPNQAELLSHFSSFLIEAGLSSVSIKNYLCDIRHFLSSFSRDSIEDIFHNLSVYVTEYTAAQKAILTPQATINRRLASIRRFATFLSIKFNLDSIFTHQNISKRNIIDSFRDQSSAFHSSNQNVSADLSQQNISGDKKSQTPPILSSDKILDQFKNSLEREKKTHSTIKNYLSDLNHFFLWTANQTPFTTQNLLNILSENQLQAYITYLKLSHTSTSVINRRQSSIKKLARFCFSEGYLPVNPFEVKPAYPRLSPLAWIERFTRKADRPQNALKNPPTGLPGHFVRLYDKYNALPWTPYLNLAILVLATTAMAIFAYNQIITQAKPGSAATALTPPKRQLSFQGRLTDSSGTPITTAVNVVFKLFNALSGPTELYSTGTCSITPDTDGIFNSLIGDGVCGSEITSSVFTDNRDVYLEITVGAETLTPRQQIATVGYAINSYTLQGYPASASATINTVPVVDNSGNITIAASSPSIISTSGTFTVSGQSVALTTAANSGGDVILQPDAIGGGQVLVLGGTTAEDSLRVTNANLTSGSLISGYVGNDTATGRLLSLTSGSSETDRFYVAADGRTGIFAGSDDSALIVNQTGTGNLFSASTSGTAKFTINNTGAITMIDGVAHTIDDVGGDLTLNSAGGDINLASGDNLGLTASTNLIFGGTTSLGETTAANDSGAYLVGTYDEFDNSNSTNVQDVLDDLDAAINVAASSGGPWVEAAGILFPKNSTVDVFLGGQATSSAKFAFLNMNSGTPTASIAGSVTGAALYATGDGTVATTNNRSLLLNPTGGNVGIGLTNPSRRLSVTAGTTPGIMFGGNSGTTVDTYNVTTTHFNIIYRSSNSRQLVYQAGYNQSAGYGHVFNVDTGTEVMRIEGNSRVGIKDTSPDATFEVVKNSTDPLLMLSSAADNNGDYLYVGNTGLIGLGTITPSAKLDILGNLNVMGAATISSTLNIGSVASVADNNQVLTLDSGMVKYIDTTAWDKNSSDDLSSANIPWIEGSGILYPKNSTVDVLLGGQATASAKIGFLNLDSGTPTASIAGSVTGAAISLTGDGTLATTNNRSLILNPIGGNVGIGDTTPAALLTVGDGDLFQVNSSGIISAIDGVAHTIDDVGGNLTLTSNSNTISLNDNVTFAGTTTLNSIAYTWPGSQTANYVLQTNGSGTLSWVDPAGAAASAIPWIEGSGILYPKNSTVDVLVGGQATSSAKFKILNMAAGTPVASMSSSYWTSDGTLATTARKSLTIGNSSTYDTTGNVLINSNGTGRVGIGTTSPTADLQVVGAEAGTEWNGTSDVSIGQFDTANSIVYGVRSDVSETVCFTAGTKISTIDGLKNIEDVNIGDKVISYNTTSNKVEIEKVTNTYVHKTYNFLTISTNGGASINVTPNHPIYSRGKWVEAGQLTVGDSIEILHNDSINSQIISSISSTQSEEPVTVYNLEVDGNHNYFAEGILVHNKPFFGAYGIYANASTSGGTAIGAYLAGGTYGLLVASGSVGIGDTTPAALFTVGNGDLFQINSSGIIAKIDNVSHTIDDVGGNLTLSSNSNTISLNDNVTFAGTTTLNGVAYTWPASDGSNGNALTTNGSGTLSWSSVLTAAAVPWVEGSGILYPKNSTVDVLVGGQATSSAKFAILNMNSGTPTASISGTTAGFSTYLTGEGNLATTNMNPLTIGGASTGTISLNSSDWDISATGDMTGIGAITADGTLSLSNNATISGTLTLGNGATNVLQTPYGPLTFNYKSAADTYTAGITLKDGTGRVGIGTTTPGYALHIVSKATNTPGLLVTGGSSVDASAGSGQIMIGSNDGANANAYISMGRNTYDLTIDNGLDNNDADILFRTKTNGTDVNALTIKGSGLIGVGTTTPTATLDIVGDASTSASLVFRSATPTIDILNNSTLTFQSSVGGDTGLGSIATLSPAGNLTLSGSLQTASILSAADLTIDPTGGDVNLGSGDNLGLTASTNLIFGGTTSLGETTAPTDSGAYLVGVNDEFDNSNNTNVQAVLNDLDAAITAASSGTGPWIEASGTLYPKNSTVDVLLGGQATASAKIGFINLDSGTPTINLANQASNIAIKDNTASALKIVQGSDTYLDITTTDDAESFSLSLPAGGATSHTANLFTSNIAQTINLGTGTAIDTINIGTGGTGADVISIGSANAGNITVQSNAALALIGSTGSYLTFPNFAIDTNGIITKIDNVAHTIDDVGGNLTLSSNSNTISLNDNVTFAGTTTLNGVAYTWPASDGSNGNALTTNGSGTLSWSSVLTAAAVPWVEGSGILYPKNSTVDVLVGGQATSSAKFAILNMNSGTPTASVSAGVSGATYLTGDGNLATTNMTPLTIGGATTDTISLRPKNVTGLAINGTGNVGVGVAPSSSYTFNAYKMADAANLMALRGSIRANNSTHTGLMSINYLSQVTHSSGGLSTINGISGGVELSHSGTGTMSTVYGSYTYIRQSSANAITNAYGDYSTVWTDASKGTISNARNYTAYLLNGSGTTISDWIGYNFSISNSGTVTTAYGMKVPDINFGGTNYAIVTNAGNIVFNEGGDSATDFRVEGDTDANLLFTDASADNVGIGTVTPSAKLDILGNLNVMGAATISSTLNIGSVASVADNNQVLTLDSGMVKYIDTTSWDKNSSDDLSSANIPWVEASGTLYPKNSTVDVLLGGQATASAKIGFINLDSGTPTINLANQASNIAVKDNTASALKIVQGSDTYLDITTTDDAESFSLSLPAGGATSHTANLFTSNIAQTINLGTGTAIDTINIGTGGTGADVISIGSANAGNITVQSNAALGLTGSTGSYLTFPNFAIDTNGIITKIDNVAHTIDDVGGNLTLTSNSNTISLNDNVTFAGTTTLNGVAYTWPASDGSSGNALTTNGSGTLSWSSVLTAAAVPWVEGSGILYPKNSTVDVLVGGQATSSAKFAILNMNSGTPTASVSAGTAGGTFLTANGYLSTTARQTLTIGNSSTYNTTGNTLINSNGTGKVGIGTTAPISKLTLSAPVGEGDTDQIAVGINPTYHLGIGYDQGSQTAGWIGNNYSNGSARVDIRVMGFASTNTNLSVMQSDVGIGTITPGTTDAAGIAAFASTNSRALEIKSQTTNNSASAVYLRNSDATVGLDITSDSRDTYTAFFDNRYSTSSSFPGGFRFRTATNTTPVDVFTILGSGNVGINTTTPTAKLDVAGDASTSASLVFRSATPTIDILNNSTLTFQSSVGGDTGLATRASLTPIGDFLPGGDNTQDFGNGDNSWSRLYLADGVYDDAGTEIINTATGNFQLTGGAWQTTGNTTFGDASGDTVTSNAATWTFANATSFAIADNAASSYKIAEGANVYLDITTTNDAESFSLSLPAGGATSHTANLFTSNIAQTINLGTGTAIDTINIGTGGTGADVITIGGGIGTVAINSGDWDIGTTGDMTGIGAITADGTITFTGTTIGLGTSNSITTFNIGTGTAGNTLNIATNNTTQDTVNIGSTLDDIAISSDSWSITNAGVASVSGTLTLGNGTTNTLQSAFGPLTLNYKSAANTWSAGMTLQDTTGYIGFGTTTPSTLLYGDYSVDGTGVSNLLSLERTDPNTPANGFGVGLSFLLDRDDTAATATESGRISMIMNDVPTASTSMTFSAIPASGSLTEIMRIGGDSRIGIGTTTPGKYIVPSYGDYAVSHILQLDGTNPRLVLRGSTTPAIDLIDTGGASGEKWLQLYNGNGNAVLRTLGDDGTISIGLLYIDLTNGNMGLQDTTPVSRLSINPTGQSYAASGNAAGIDVNAASVTLSGANPTTYANAFGNVLRAFTYNGTNANQTVTNPSTLYIATPVAGTNVTFTNNKPINTQSGGYLTSTGTWTNAPSYRRYKDTYSNTSSYLDKLAGMDVFEWQYKNEVVDGLNRYQDDKNRHASPFLDDFYATFGLGNDQGVNVQDLAGVALASIKELNSRFESYKNTTNNSIAITSDGEVTLSGNAVLGYTVTTPTGITDRIAAFAQATTGYFKAGLAVVNDLVVDNLVVKTKLISPLADIDQLNTINATVSGTLYANNIEGQTIDTLHSQLNLLDEKYSTASAILAQLQAKYTSYDSLVASSQTATDSADPLALSSLATSSATLPSDLSVITFNSQTITTGDLLATGSIFATSFSSLDTDLFIQPTGDKPVHLLANLMTLYPDGQVVVNGDLLINGNIYAKGLETQTATVSGSLAVGSIESSGSANFSQLVTGGLVIAADNTSTSSTVSAAVNSNTTIGTATIASGSAEIAINNNKVTDNTLIYITPVSDTNNQVLYVKSKQSGVGFTVAIPGNPELNSKEISFNYWLVETKK